MAKKILVVDDEQSIRESLSKILRVEGYQTALAENGREAIEKVIQEHIDLMLLDLGLPVKDGWATLRWLAQATPSLPVIVITGRWKQEELAKAAGVDVLMEKPLDAPRLLQHIRELLQETPVTHNREPCFRSVSAGIERFREQWQKRFTTPCPAGGPTHSRPH